MSYFQKVKKYRGKYNPLDTNDNNNNNNNNNNDIFFGANGRYAELPGFLCCKSFNISAYFIM